MNPFNIFKFLLQVLNKWMDDKAFKMSAALSFYTIISLGPLLYIAIWVAGVFFGKDAATGQIVTQIQDFIGHDVAVFIQKAIINLRSGGSNLLTTIISISILLFSSTALFAELHDSLNIIFRVKSKEGKVFLSLVLERLISFIMVLVTGVFLILSLIVGTIISFLSNILGQYFAIHVSFINLVNLIIMSSLTFLLFAVIYKYLSDARLSWKDVFLGSAITTGLFLVGRYLINLYIQNTNYKSAFGAAGSLVILLLWVYYSSQIILFGAEFIYVYAKHYGKGVKTINICEPID
ncbi:MAG TPA: YihY/virulence factor BrkB family protein [Bacteroidota bacterium]|nr:YihY/virulence factor BrkB family protein [Bacteroidota bacterium]